jgi:hypothetical protein
MTRIVLTGLAAAVFAGLTFTAAPADAQTRGLPSSPVTLNKRGDAAKPRFEQSNLPVPAGRWGTSSPLSRPCYAGTITEPCSTPGPSVRIELPGIRVKK